LAYLLPCAHFPRIGQLPQLLPPLHFDSDTRDSVRSTWTKASVDTRSVKSLHDLVYDLSAVKRLGGTRDRSGSAH